MPACTSTPAWGAIRHFVRVQGIAASSAHMETRLVHRSRLWQAARLADSGRMIKFPVSASSHMADRRNWRIHHPASVL